MSSGNGNIATRRETGGAELRAVHVLLDSARNARRPQAAGHVILTGITAGLALTALAQLASLAGLADVPVVAIGLTGLFAGIVGFGLFAWLRRPSAIAIARSLETRLGLKERLSTALEARHAPHAGDATERTLRDALFADAETSAAAVAPDAVKEHHSWRIAWFALFLLAIVLALATIDASRPAPVETALPPPAVTQEEQEATEAVLREIADLIHQDVDTSATPLMQALARTVDAVRNDLAAGELDRKELTDALQDLSAQAGRAGAELGRGTGARIEQALGNQIDALARGPQAPPAAPQDLGAPKDKPVEAPTQTSSEPLPTTAAAQTSLQGDQPPPKATGNYYTPDPHDVARQNAERAAAEMLNPGRPAGGAREADRGGNQAGEGVRPLVASFDDLAALSQSAFETMILPENDASAGQRVRINTMPPEAGPEVSVGGAADTAGWQAGEVEPQNRNATPLRDLEILRRYFPQSAGEF